MKVRIPFIRLLPTLLIIIIIGGAAIFGMSFTLFVFTFPYDWRQYAIIGVWVLLSIGLIVVTILTSYYEVNKKYVSVKRGTKTLIYYFADVVYIDEEKSEKKKMVHFYTRQGHARYLLFDKEAILYKTMIVNCKNRLTKEEFARQYPQVKL